MMRQSLKARTNHTNKHKDTQIKMREAVCGLDPLVRVAQS